MGVAELYACVQVRKWLQCQGVVSGVSAIWRYKIRCKNALGPRIVSAVRSLEVVASRRLPMYYKYGIFNP